MSVVKVKCPVCGSENVSKMVHQKLEKRTQKNRKEKSYFKKTKIKRLARKKFILLLKNKIYV